MVLRDLESELEQQPPLVSMRDKREIRSKSGGCMADRTVRLNIRRQDNPQSQPYWAEFELQWRAGMNVISALMDLP